MGFLNMFKRKPGIKDLPAEISAGLSSEQADMIESRSMALFTQQWDFYRTGYYSMLRVSTIKDVIIILLLFVALFLSAQGVPQTAYVAVDAEGRLTKLEPINTPALTDEQVRNFVRDAVTESFTFNYMDLDQRTAAASKFYSDKGYSSYMGSIKTSGLKEQILDKRLLVKTVVDGSPVIQDKGVYGGRYVWTVTVDVVRTLTDRVKSQDSLVTYTFYMYRVPSTEKASQIAIYNYGQKVTQRQQ
ncbi:MAG TPA: DotI/IcmL/TraM family protein [Ignavibacteriaceae bacterium]